MEMKFYRVGSLRVPFYIVREESIDFVGWLREDDVVVVPHPALALGDGANGVAVGGLVFVYVGGQIGYIPAHRRIDLLELG